MTALLRRHTTLVLVVLATLVHLAVWLALPADLGGNESSDFTNFYEPVARSVLDGHGLEDADGEPAVRYPPGFPVLLAGPLAVGDATGASSETVAAVLLAVTMGLSCGVLHRIGRRLFGRLVALVGAGLWALWPLNLWLAKQPNSEVPYTLLLLLAVLATVRAADDEGSGARDALLAGLAVAGATLVRPAGVALVPPLVLWLWWSRRRAGREVARPLGLVAAGLAVLLVPWIAWASLATGAFVPVAEGGRDTVAAGLEVGIDQKATEGGRTLAMPSGLRALLEDLSAQEGEGELDTTGAVVVAVAQEVPDRPVAVAQLVGFKALRSWYGTDSLRYETPIALVQLAVAALVALGSVRAWRAGVRRRSAAVLLLGVLGTSWLLTMAVTSLVRYLTPALGLCLLLAAVALEPPIRRLLGPPGPDGPTSAAAAPD